MNTPKMGPAGHAVSSPAGAGDSPVNPVAQPSAALAIAGDAGEQTVRSMEIFARLQTLAKPESLRVAIKVRGRILFINLGDVVAVQAEGKCVLLHQNARSHLLRQSISVVAEMLETHGFIRIHRSVLVNTSFVEEIRPLSTENTAFESRAERNTRSPALTRKISNRSRNSGSARARSSPVKLGSRIG